MCTVFCSRISGEMWLSRMSFAFPLEPVLQRFLHFLQQNRQGLYFPEGTEESVGLLTPFMGSKNMALQRFIADNDIIFLRKMLQPHGQIAGVGDIDEENAVEHPNEKRKSQIPGKPVQAVEHAGMDEKVINSAQSRPEKGKQGTDETLHISPQV